MMQQVSFALQRVRRVSIFQQQASSLLRKHGASSIRAFSLRPTTPSAAATGVMGARPAMATGMASGASRIERRAPAQPIVDDEKDRELIDEDEIVAGEAEAQLGDAEDQDPLSTPGAEDDIDELPINAEIKNRLKNEFGIQKLFSVQSRAFEPIVNRKDLILKSRTGTGKTLAFCLPLAQRLLESNTRPRPGSVRAVVLEPTRELAKQVVDELAKVSPRLRTAAIYGGVGYEQQERAIKGGIDILVGTPGRIIDHLEKGTLRLDEVSMCVLDEADRMLQIGFTEAVERILEDMPKAPERQTVLCSATMPNWVNSIARDYLTQPETIDCVGSSELRVADTITHYALCSPFNVEQKAFLVADVIDCHTKGRVIIFTETKNDADYFATHPAFRGQARALHGDIPQARREETLSQFKQEGFRVLVATDVAARGIDIPEVEMVVQVFFPKESDSFIHRAGRTGRAGRKGINVLVVSENERGMLPTLSEKTGAVFNPMYPPTQQDTLQTAVERVKEQMSTILAQSRGRDGSLRPSSSIAMFLPQIDNLLKDPSLNLDANSLSATLLAMTCGAKFGTRRSLLSSRPGYATCVITGRGNMNVRDVLRVTDAAFGSSRGSMQTGRVVFARGVGAVDVSVDQMDKFLNSINHQLPHEIDGFKIDFPSSELPKAIYEAAVNSAMSSASTRFNLDSGRGGFGGRQRASALGGGREDRFGGRSDREDRFGGRSDREDRFGGRSDRSGGRSDRFGGREDKFGGREDRFGGRSDRFGGRDDRESRFGGRDRARDERPSRSGRPSFLSDRSGPSRGGDAGDSIGGGGKLRARSLNFDDDS